MIVQFEEEILRAQNVAKFRRALPRLGHVVGLDRHVDLALQTAAHADQARGMLREQLLVDPRLVMHPVEMRGRDQLYQVAVAGFVLGQEGEMIGRVALIIRPILDRTRRHVRLATDDRFDPGVLRFLVKLDRAVEVAVIGDRDRRHPNSAAFLISSFIRIAPSSSEYSVCRWR